MKSREIEPPTPPAIPATGTLQDEVRERFGVLPNFFRLAPETPEITANLWGFAKFAYLDNPLPSIFKERLFVYLSRFCDVRYCISRHVGFLIGLGRPAGDATVAPMSIDDVLRLLRNRLADGDELERAIGMCTTCQGPLSEALRTDSAIESAVINCATHVFLQTPRAAASAEALRRALGETAWQHLTVFLAFVTFVRTAHYWTKVHAELGLEEDILELMRVQEHLADCLLNDPEADRSAVAQRVAQELEDLRAAHAHSELERQHSSDLLRESEDKFRAAFESSVVGFAILRPDTTFEQLNDAFCAITGYTRGELKGTRCSSLTHPNDQAASDALVADLLSGARTSFLLEKRYLRKDGAVIWVQNSVSATRDKNGDPQHLVVVCQDVTERRQASEMKDQFLATLSHELRTPLNAVLGWAQMLRAGTLRGEMATKAVASIERNARAQVTLVDELLDVSRIITGKLEIEQEILGLLTPIASAVDAVRPAATAKHLSLSVSAERSAECYVKGDVDRLQQVFLNLLSNAVKFTPEGGAIEVAVHCNPDHALVHVRDNGQGISPELQPFIFERFRQGDNATTRLHGGLGLGLAIVRHLTEAHGGTVSVESRGDGCGTTFTIRLPLTEVPWKLHTTTTTSDSPQSRSLRGARILVVDDVLDARDLMRVALESAEAEVTAVSSAADALAALAAGTFDVVLADIGMPDQDGYTLIEALRREESGNGRGLPVVAVSAYARVADRQKALAAGFDRHIAKPVEPAALIESVGELLTTGRTSHSKQRS
jgi:PAS domain S-box-containing protein